MYNRVFLRIDGYFCGKPPGRFKKRPGGMKIKNSRRPTGRELKPGKPNGREKLSKRVNSDGQDKSDEPGKPNDRDKQISPGKPGRETIRKKDKEKEGRGRAKGVGDNSANGQARRRETGRGRRGAGAQTAVCGRAESQGFPLTGRTLAAIGFPKISWYRRKYSSNVSGVPKESNSICTPKRHTRKGSGVMPWRR